MRIKSFKWKVLLMLLPLWFVYNWLSGDSGLINQVRLYHDNQALLRKIDSLQREKKTLDKERARLRSDTAYLEKIARAELGMALPQEKIYRLYEGGAPPPLSSPAQREGNRKKNAILRAYQDLKAKLFH